MSLGTTANLRRALKAHQEEGGATEAQAPAGTTDDADVDQGELLRSLSRAAAGALQAHEAGDDRALRSALGEVKRVVGQCHLPSVDEPSPAPPTIMLPKVRRTFALAMEGLGDVERHLELVQTLGIDGVTARMLAIARQPRIALRSDDRQRLDELAQALKGTLGIKAAVFDRDEMLDIGPARLLTSFSDGVRAVTVSDWLADLHAIAKRDDGDTVNEPPWLVAAGEVVILRYKPGKVGGRLKHLREGKLEAASEQRLAVVDLHLSSGIVRILEGATDLSAAPGAIMDGFRRTLRVLSEQWTEHGVAALEPRTCAPAMDSAHTRIEEHGGRIASGWPEWEEHSRSARLLFKPD